MTTNGLRYSSSIVIRSSVTRRNQPWPSGRERNAGITETDLKRRILVSDYHSTPRFFSFTSLASFYSPPAQPRRSIAGCKQFTTPSHKHLSILRSACVSPTTQLHPQVSGGGVKLTKPIWILGSFCTHPANQRFGQVR